MERSEREGWVYIIEARELQAVKIGFTSGSVEKRLRDLQTGSPCALELVAAQRGTMADERDLQATLADYRIRGEWFDKGGLPVKFLVDEIGGR